MLVCAMFTKLTSSACVTPGERLRFVARMDDFHHGKEREINENGKPKSPH